MDKLKFAFTILIVLGAGLFAVNQFLAFKYKAEMFSSPCALCCELNPEYQCPECPLKKLGRDLKLKENGTEDYINYSFLISAN